MARRFSESRVPGEEALLPMSISVIVPVWNGRELLARLLASVAAQEQAAGELLVVDNGSSDRAPELARERGARVIPMGRNAGFAAAVNRGISEARGEWIAVLNSDVELAPDYFSRLTRSNAWFATGKILAAGTNDRIDGTYDAVCRGGTAWRVGSGLPDGPLFSRPERIWSAPWTAVLLRAELFRKAGLLEESFESYLEDVEFGLRCAALGLAGEYLPDARAWHRGSATLGEWHPETVRRIARNQVLLVARHYSSTVLRQCIWPILVAQVLWGLVAFRHGTGIAWLKGKWQGLARFAETRKRCATPDPILLDHLRECEESIRKIQAATRFEAYWRVYFLLTRGGAK
jgi:GT2 family glycosyltransferase